MQVLFVDDIKNFALGGFEPLGGISNLRIKKEGCIVAGPVEPGQRSLDDLPFPNRILTLR